VTPRASAVGLAGYASRTQPVSTILDRIEISAVLLESGGNRCLILSFDLLAVGTELQDMINTRLAKRGFGVDEIVLLASHTHTAPATDRSCFRLGATDNDYVDSLTEAVDNLVLKLQGDKPEDVKLEILRGELEHSIHRRLRWSFPTLSRSKGLRFSSIIMAPNRQGPTDETASVLLLRKVNCGTVLGIIWHYTCHPTAVAPDNVVSSDFPGAVRRALRGQFGEIACVFAQGFCGDIRPNMRPVQRSTGLRDRLSRFASTLISGASVPVATFEDWQRWSTDLAAKVLAIAQGTPIFGSAQRLATGSARVPLKAFFRGRTPDKDFSVYVVQIGGDVEVIAMSAEPSVEWQQIISEAIPVRPGTIRLYTGYLGSMFGYLPTPAQIPEGGYEVTGFQLYFGLSGEFSTEKIASVVVGCVAQAFEELEDDRPELKGAGAESSRT
jgi:hypothetical protein